MGSQYPHGCYSQKYQQLVVKLQLVLLEVLQRSQAVHRQTVSRALKELDAKGFIDLELLQVRTKVKPKGLWCNDTPEFIEDTDGVMTHRG